MNWQIPSNAPSELQRPVIDIRTMLPVNPKYSWISRNGARDLRKLTTIVVHHDALSKAVSKPYSDIDFAKRIATSHIRSKHNIPGGDPGFPYHVWIRSGNIYVCNELEAFTYGVANNNSYTVHVSVSGNYAGVDSLAADDRNALYAAIMMLQSMVPTLQIVKAHKEITKTACPGFDINKVRADVLDIAEHMSAVEDSLPVRAYTITARVKQLGQRLSDPKWGDSAAQKLGWLVDYVEGSYSSETVVAVVGEWYKLKQFDKVIALEPVMKEKGLL